MILWILFLAGFILVHLSKMLRLYLVLMEHKIPFWEFVLLYLKTTLVNFIIPFKIGEVYRFYCISRKTKHWQVGILSILVDRFFDMLALCMVLVPCDILFVRRMFSIAYPPLLSNITVIFLVVLIVIVVCYISILPTYRYLNRYLIKEKTSSRSLAALKGLDVVKDWFDFTRKLISGRFALILLSSLAGWIFEVFTIGVLAKALSEPFDAMIFINYIQSIFGMGSRYLLSSYTRYSVLLMAIFLLLALLVSFIGRCKKKVS